MVFENPLILWGLIGVSIPILIHLLQLRRYKSVLFSDVRFLKNVQKSSKKRRRLKHWLILATRILAWSTLSLAFAIPMLEDDTSRLSNGESVIIYVDNSPSMNRRGAEGPLWTQAVETAKQVVRDNPQSNFYVLTSSGDGNEMIPKKGQMALSALQSIQPGFSSQSVQDVIIRASTLGLQDSVVLYLFTDNQENNFAAIDDQGLPLTFVPVIYRSIEEDINASIDTVFIESPVIIPGQVVLLKYQISTTAQMENVPLELWVNNEVRGVQNLNLKEGNESVGSFSFTADNTERLAIELKLYDGGLEIDNYYPLALAVRKNIAVLHIRDDELRGLNIEKIIADSSYIVNTSTYGNIAFSELSNYDLIVADRTNEWTSGLANALLQAVESGSSLLLFPEGPSTNDLMSLNVAGFGEYDTASSFSLELNTNRRFFEGVFYQEPERVQFPRILKFAPVDQQFERFSGNALVQASTGVPILLQYDKGAGQVYQWAAHPESDQQGWTDLYSVFIYQMAIYKGKLNWNSVPLAVAKNIEMPHEVSTTDAVVRLIQDSALIIPQQSITANTVTFKTAPSPFVPGFAQVIFENDTIGSVAYRVHPEESALDPLDSESIKSRFEETSFRIAEADSGSEASNQIAALSQKQPLFKYWLWAVIIVLILEMILWRQPKA